MDRIADYGRALALFEDWLARQSEPGAPSPEALLAAHPDLHEILEGMLLAADVGDEGDDESPSTVPSEPSSAADDAERIGPYRLEGVLGQGGMGTVYRARHVRLQRPVALKVIRSERLWSPIARLRFEREARAVARLDDPGICPVYEVGEDRGQPYMVMRLVEGQSLAARLAAEREAAGRRSTSRGTIRDHVALFARIARALQVAHAQGIVHRDIKPANIMITASGQPVLLDFGLAQLDEGPVAGLTMTGDQPGTPMYMSPEQVDPRGRTPDCTTDVWALGVCLYEALAGERPFAGDSLREIQDAVLLREPPRLTQRDRQIPADLSAIVEKAIDKDRSRRYRTAGDFADDLERHYRHEPVHARRAGAVLRTRRWAQRNPLATSFLLTMAVALITITWLWLDHRSLLHQYDLLAWGERLEFAESSEPELYPAVPDRRALFVRWVEEHGAPIAKALPDLERSLAQLRERALAQSEPWTFAAATEQFRHDSLAGLVAGAQRFVQMQGGALPRVRAHLDWLDRVEALSIEGPTAAWRRAADEIAQDARYRGLALRPQVGLVPVGADPHTGLQEFAHLRSGTVPARDAQSGTLACDGESGIVFVLLPGGPIHVGAQSTDPGAPHFDPEARSNEGPVQRLELAPFFLAKHELTQGQWERLGEGARPSSARAGRSYAGVRVDRGHPVENISWNEAHELLHRYGLALPTEAQWEYGCRGGTSSPWCTGDDYRSLEGAVNFADRTAAARGAAWTQIRDWPELDDGYTLHAPAASMRPNGFGLHHVHGNVYEWCQDSFATYDAAPAARGDGLRQPPDATMRVIRGGSFDNSFRQARAAYRRSEAPNARGGNLGLRAARPLR